MWGISLPQIIIILLIVLLIFGTKRLRTLGGDLGSALKGFRKAMDEGESEPSAQLTDKDKDDAATAPSAEEAGRETEKVDRTG